ncbi:MAG: 2-C-methyl-D-erythritol 2,4-cyclodiphosphate synthase [Candidatus Omnitrophota bacterium]
MIKVGIGYDIHRLAEGRKLYIGGVEIPYIKGLLGHSDGDVLLHAVCDALLGAMSYADIGEVFPDTDPAYLGISSVELLKRVRDLLESKGYVINNLDTVVIAEEPRLEHFKAKMIECIAGVLKIGISNVVVKAKTNEGVGSLGRKEAIAAWASVLIEQR